MPTICICKHGKISCFRYSYYFKTTGKLGEFKIFRLLFVEFSFFLLRDAYEREFKNQLPQNCFHPEVANGNQDWFHETLMSYAQFSCSDFLRVLFQLVRYRIKKKKPTTAKDIAHWRTRSSQRKILTPPLITDFSGQKLQVSCRKDVLTHGFSESRLSMDFPSCPSVGLLKSSSCFSRCERRPALTS